MIGHGIPDLPRGQLVNVNYPKLNAERTEPTGIAYTSTALASATALTYVPTTGSTFEIKGARNTEVPAVGSDMALLAEGKVTVSVLDADRSVAAADAPAVASLVRRLNGEKEPAEPTKPTKPTVKPAVEKLAKRVAGGTSVWVRATGLDAKTLTITWKAAKKGKKAPKTVTRNATVRGVLFQLVVPAKAGQYQVKVVSAGKTLRTSGVKVL